MPESEPAYRIAVDVGGTFTDVTLSDPASGDIATAKVLTTPADRGQGVLDGIRAVFDAQRLGPGRIREIVHGSTTGTNALIERSGATVGFLTTEGFRDLLEIGRVQRPMEGLYDISIDRPPPLVPRHRCLTVRERIGADAGILEPLDEDGVRAAAARFREMGVEAVAVCFLSSYLNPAHERRAAEILAAELPDRPISISSQLAPEYREYERASTAVINAYLTPVMGAYLDGLERRIAAEIGEVPLFVIQANGGSTSVAEARARAVTTVNSGPAGGVVAAAYYGRRRGRDKIVSVDMGGTSFDIGLIEDGASKVTTEGGFQGLPVKIPILDLHIIGAGGGSIAWIDPGGALNVGPRSAGAEPGPACYGRGGGDATVTDANLVLGRLNADYFNGGRMKLDVEAARAAIGRVAGRLGLGLEETALGIVKVVNANMAKGIASVTIQRGIDARDFSLFSFGGAGGAHAVDLARELSMAEAIVPPMPGTFSALGLLVTEMRHDYVTALGGVTAERARPAELEARLSRDGGAGQGRARGPRLRPRPRPAGALRRPQGGRPDLRAVAAGRRRPRRRRSGAPGSGLRRSLPRPLRLLLRGRSDRARQFAAVGARRERADRAARGRGGRRRGGAGAERRPPGVFRRRRLRRRGDLRTRPARRRHGDPGAGRHRGGNLLDRRAAGVRGRGGVRPRPDRPPEGLVS